MRFSREAAVTVVPDAGEGVVEAGVGPIEVATPQKTWRLFTTNHEFPRMACITRKLAAGAEEPAGSSEVADLAGACGRAVRHASAGAKSETVDTQIEMAARGSRKTRPAAPPGR